MRVRQLDDKHDWTFGVGRGSYAADSDAVRQCVLTRLLSLREDWFLNPDDGLRWFDWLEKNPDLRSLEAAIKSTVLATRGVTALTDFSLSMDADRRKMTVSVGYRDEYGEEREVSTHAPGY